MRRSRITTMCISLGIFIFMTGCTKQGLADLSVSKQRSSGQTINNKGGVLPPNSDSINDRDCMEDQLVGSPPDTSSYIDSSTAQRIFEDVYAQGETLWGRYFRDGQYVYSHAIRRYVEGKYGISCMKMFLFGDMSAVSPRYDCCVSWKYDVACVLQGKNGRVYVIDPRLHTSVVTADVWIKAHVLPTACEPDPAVASSELVSGECFSPNGGPSLGYKVDKDYRLTDIMLAYYADSSGCHCTTSNNIM